MSYTFLSSIFCAIMIQYATIDIKLII